MLRQAGGDRGICNGFGHGDLHCVCVGLLSVLIILMGPNVSGGVEGRFSRLDVLAGVTPKERGAETGVSPRTIYYRAK